MKALGLALVMVLACAAALWFLSSDDGAAPSPAPDRAVPVRAVSHRGAPSLPARVASVAPVVHEPAREAPPVEEVSLAKESAAIEARFAVEHADSSWASESTRTITEDMRKVMTSDVRLENVECRSSLCRAELAMTSQEAGNTFLATWVSQTTWPGAGLFAPDAAHPESPRVIVYLARKGTSLRQAD